MKQRVFSLCLLILAGFLPFKQSDAWEGGGVFDSADRILDVIRLVEKVEAGRTNLAKARAFWNVKTNEALKKFIVPGKVSRTDAVLTRHYSPDTGEEVRERTVKVILRLDQPLVEIALDFIHELTHAVTEPNWDPYDPELSVGKYILAALEARGGEIEAVETECRAAFEYVKKTGLHITRCDRYFQTAGIDRSKIQKDFYRVGKDFKMVMKRLGGEHKFFPVLSQDEPELYSATGGAPYPVALIHEYDEINQVACENVRRRVEGSKPNRAPASASQLLEIRCSERDS